MIQYANQNEIRASSRSMLTNDYCQILTARESAIREMQIAQTSAEWRVAKLKKIDAEMSLPVIERVMKRNRINPREVAAMRNREIR